MPGYRFVLILWLTGLVLLFGCWTHSIFRLSLLAHSSRGGTLRIVRLSQGGISLESVKAAPLPSGVNRWHAASRQHRRISEVAIFGRFRWADRKSAIVPTGKVCELPIWFVLLLFTLLCLPFFLRAHHRFRHRPGPHAPGP